MKVRPSYRSWFDAACIAARDHDVLVARVVGNCRRKSTTKARWAAWHALVTKNPNYSINQIAKVGGFDHTSVLHAMRRIAEGGAA